jgi:hypothetical protein
MRAALGWWRCCAGWAWSTASRKRFRASWTPDKPVAFIQQYETLLNQMGDDEAVLFGDAVHPTHAVRPVGCWAPKDLPVAVPQSSGRERLTFRVRLISRPARPA